MKRSLCIMVLICLILVAAAPVFAQRRTTIKLSSLVPEQSPWGDLLNRMAAEWYRATNGEVEMIISHGMRSDEADLLRQLNLNQIQAAMLSVVGLKLIMPEVMTLSCPFLIRNNEELDLVLKELKPDIEARINRRGYHTLAWSKVGWIRFFSKNPVFVPADLKRQKMGTSESEPELMDAFRAMDYQMVPVAMNQILVSLSGGQIDAVYQSPVIAGGLQIFGRAKNMASIQVAPFMGAIVMNQRAWRSIPERHRETLMRITRRMEAELDASVQAFEAELVESFTEYGLVINQVSPEQEQLWYADMEAMADVFDRAMYNRINALLMPRRGGR